MMKHLLSLTVFLALTFSWFFMSAQTWNIGPKINLGASWIRSENLVKSMETQKAIDPNAETFEQSAVPGLTFGAGASILYTYNTHFGVLSEVTWNRSSSTYEGTYKASAMVNNDRVSLTEQSVVSFNTQYISVPIMLRYSPFENQGLYLLGGVLIDFTGNPMLEANETRNQVTTNNNVVIKSEVSNTSVKASSNVYKDTRLSLAAGIGYTIKIGEHSLLIDLRYSLPFTGSPLYTVNEEFAAKTYENGQVFSKNGKILFESYEPQKLLDDFKFSSVKLSVGFLLYHRSAVTCFQAAKRCW